MFSFKRLSSHATAQVRSVKAYRQYASLSEGAAYEFALDACTGDGFIPEMTAESALEESSRPVSHFSTLDTLDSSIAHSSKEAKAAKHSANDEIDTTAAVYNFLRETKTVQAAS